MAWTDEIAFCLAHRAIRFPDLGKARLGKAPQRFLPQVAFRRLFSDGRAVVRVEVGLAHDHHRGQRLRQLAPANVLQIVADACSLDTLIPAIAAPQKPLLRQGKALALLYARATTRRNSRPSSPTDFPLVQGGNPLVVVELEPDEMVGSPNGFNTVAPEKACGAILSFGRLQTPAGVTGVWLVQRGTAKLAERRSLRLCLLRLHAEQEALDLMLKQLKSRRILFEEDGNAAPPSASVVDDLNEYFNQATRLIQRDRWSGISQSEIVSALNAADHVTPIANRLNLVERFEGARKQVWKKIEAHQAARAAVRLVNIINVAEGGLYVEKNVTTTVSGKGNIVNVGEYMANITNQVNQNLSESGAPAEVQDLVRQLAEQIAQLAPKIDPGKSQQMGGDLKTLTEEMAKPEPRRKWYELSLEGLTDAAKALGQIAEPVLNTVKLLAKLILV